MNVAPLQPLSATRIPGTRSGGDDTAAGGAPHAERVSLGAEARERARHLAPPPSGHVRWYRARRTTAAPAPAPSGPAPRPVHRAVQAYLRQAASAGAA